MNLLASAPSLSARSCAHLCASRLVLATGLLLCAGATLAQGSQPYKVTGPDGRVTYTDRPAANARSVRPLGSAAAASGSGEDALEGLPYALRQAALRYPVTLYAAAACSPCNVARQALQQRGVPFKEWRVDSATASELQRREGATSLPILRVGSSRLLGFEATEWRRTLDAAGYPASNTLPPHWRGAAVEDLPAPQAAQVLKPAARAAEQPAEAVAPAGSAGGFRF